MPLRLHGTAEETGDVHADRGGVRGARTYNFGIGDAKAGVIGRAPQCGPGAGFPRRDAGRCVPQTLGPCALPIGRGRPT